MESDNALNVYSEAKSEYMFQLCSYLTPAYFSFYLDLLERAKSETAAEPKKHLWQFQNLLAEIEDWNMERVSREVAGILTRANCDFLEDLLTAVFIAHTKVLTAIRLNSKQKKVQITVPKIDHFLLKVFCETSRLLWQSAYLFRENVSGMEKQQNYRQVQGIIENGIRSAIRAMVPVKSLLKDCVHGGPDDDDSDEEEEIASEPVVEAPVKASVEPAVEPVVEAPVKAPMEPALEPVVEVPMEASTVTVPELAAEEAPRNLIVVDDAPQVAFSEYETIFDMENSDGNYIQPTQFHEAESYEDSAIEILDEVGVPLDADDLDTIDGDGAKAIEFEELM